LLFQFARNLASGNPPSVRHIALRIEVFPKERKA
jgi:hypothetical protein